MKYVNVLFSSWHFLLMKVKKYLFIRFGVIFVSTQIFCGLKFVYMNCTVIVTVLKYMF